MLVSCRTWSLIVLSCFLAGIRSGSAADAQSQSQQKPVAASNAGDQADQKQQPSEQQLDQQDEDLSPAALQLDVSQSSPLIQKLYQATRETKEQAILDRLAEAKKLLDDGADAKATDRYGTHRFIGRSLDPAIAQSRKSSSPMKRSRTLSFSTVSRSTAKTSITTLLSTI